jgi:superoxide dismutase
VAVVLGGTSAEAAGRSEVKEIPRKADGQRFFSVEFKPEAVGRGDFWREEGRPGTPLLVLDAWEHAFYLQYQNRKAEFFDAVWNLWNWDDVTARFNWGRGTGAEHEVPVGRAD